MAGDLGGEPAGLDGRRVAAGGMERGAQIAVAEARGGEFSAGDRLEEREVLRGADAEGPHTPAAVAGRLRDLIEDAVRRRGIIGGSQGVVVPGVGVLGDLRAAMKIGDALAERTPRQAAVGIILEWAEGLEVGSVGDGGFGA